MNEWYHSGLEAYCKAAADLIGSHTDGESVLGLCRDLLPDRKAGPSLSHAWELSSNRNGDRKCRQRLFEMLWLNEVGSEVFRDEAEMLAGGQVPVDGYRTIAPGSSYEQKLLSCKDEKERSKAANDQFESGAVRAITYLEDAESYTLNEEEKESYRTIPKESAYSKRLDGCRDAIELKRIAIGQCEKDALDECVKRAIQVLTDEDAIDSSYVVVLAQTEDFPVKFFTSVVPAIERGLLSERFHSTEIQRYTQTLNGLIYMAHRCLLDEGSKSGIEPFRKFVVSLFAGLIYGPSHPLALGLSVGTTPTFFESGIEGYDRREGTTIRITQVFDGRGAHTGYSGLFRSSQVVFFGRSSETEDYLERCKELFSDNAEVLSLITGCDTVIYPIVLHAAVSGIHGMLLCEGDIWRFYDLRSTNGSCVITENEAMPVDHLIEIRPGDLVRLGAPADVDAEDVNVYMDAATLAVSSHVDLAEDYV